MKLISKPTAGVQELCDALCFIDDLAEEGLGQIETVARMAALSLQTPEGCHDTAMLAKALAMIAAIAQRVVNDINAKAEGAGCAFPDPAARRALTARHAARVAAHDGGAA